MAGGVVTSPGLESDRVDLKLSLCYYQPCHMSLDESHPLAEPRFPRRSQVETGACPRPAGGNGEVMHWCAAPGLTSAPIYMYTFKKRSLTPPVSHTDFFPIGVFL